VVDLEALRKRTEQAQRRLGALQATLEERQRQHQTLEQQLRDAGYPVDDGPEAVAKELQAREQRLEDEAQAAQDACARAEALMDQAEGKSVEV